MFSFWKQQNKKSKKKNVFFERLNQKNSFNLKKKQEVDLPTLKTRVGFEMHF